MNKQPLFTTMLTLSLLILAGVGGYALGHILPAPEIGSYIPHSQVLTCHPKPKMESLRPSNHIMRMQTASSS